MKIVFLTLNYVPYHVIFIKTLISRYDAEIHSFSISRSIPYIPKDIAGLHTYKMDCFNVIQALQLIESIKPQIMFVGGWFYNDYNQIAKHIKEKYSIPIVAACDSQWSGGKQWINVLLSGIRQRKWFTHLFVSGARQYVYARKLGFSDKNILLHNYSCDVELFSKIKERIPFPKRFIFVGRFAPEKGINYLISAWDSISDKRGWELMLIGNGELENNFIHHADVIIKGSMPQEQLIVELSNSGCFILPSVLEPWAVVIHEAVAAGLPVICTDVCGAATHFVINGYNGYQVPAKSISHLKEAMEKIMDMPDERLLTMGKFSRELSTIITPEKTAATFMSVLEN